jgi:hypothetical protein
MGSMPAKPSFSTNSRRAVLGSETTTRSAPNRRAANAHACPIGPPPITNTASSGPTRPLIAA